PAIPVSSTLLCGAPDAATPTTRLATEMVPSLAPRTAARSQPMRPDLWDSLCMRAMVALLSTLRSQQELLGSGRIMLESRRRVLGPHSRADWGGFRGMPGS